VFFFGRLASPQHPGFFFTAGGGGGGGPGRGGPGGAGGNASLLDRPFAASVDKISLRENVPRSCKIWDAHRKQSWATASEAELMARSGARVADGAQPL
jgi:hypothetical protein